MARIRTLKPEFWTDEKLALMPPVTRLVFLGLVSQADDAGRLVDNVKLLDGMLFPYTDDSCGESLDELARLGRILRYRSASGQPLIQLVNWEKHQKVQKPSLYTLPAPTQETVRTSPGVSPETLQRLPVSDLGPRTVDHGPRTDDPPRTEPTDDDHRRDCVDFVTSKNYGPTERLIAEGEDVTIWKATETGEAVPWPDRLRLLKLAHARVQEKLNPALRTALKWVIPQQYDPFKAPKAADKPAHQYSKSAPEERAPPSSPADEIARLKTDYPELFAEVLDGFERCAWWDGEPEREKARHLRLAIKEKLGKPPIALVS